MNAIFGILLLIGIIYLIYLVVKGISHIIHFVKDKIHDIKNNKPLSKEEQEERQKQEKENREKYKNDVLSGAISFEEEINEISNKIQKNNLSLMKFSELYENYNNNPNSNLRYNLDIYNLSIISAEIYYYLDKLKLISEVKDDPIIGKLINDYKQLESFCNQCQRNQGYIRYGY